MFHRSLLTVRGSLHGLRVCVWGGAGQPYKGKPPSYVWSLTDGCMFFRCRGIGEFDEGFMAC